MSLQVYKDTIIFVVCPAHFATGGTEALHQLHFKIHRNGFKTVMYYVDVEKDRGSPIPERYKDYNVSYVTKVEDSGAHIIIVPETYSNLLHGFNMIRKAIWWLSIDNYFKRTPSKPFKWINSMLRKAFGRTCADFFGFQGSAFRSSAYSHFTQSRYAYDFLVAKGVSNLYMLSDYLTVEYLRDMTQLEKRNRVLYNPIKGIKNTKVLLEASPNIDWMPLKDMSLTQVKDSLASSKVYIDFGHHPGKDRLPREAAINGCCVLTGREGSADNAVDIAIPDAYKFRNVKQQKEEIIALIEQCFEQYELHRKNFLLYVEKIQSEEQIFEQEILGIFQKNENSYAAESHTS